MATVYFLGAGASADAGIPLTGQLLKGVERRVGKASHTGRLIRELGLSGVPAESRPTIVEFISVIDACIREERPLDRLFSLERLRRIREETTIQLSHVIGRPRGNRGALVVVPSDARAQVGSRGLRIASYYREFARKLAKRTQDSTIITTNYDTQIDVALYEAVYTDESNISDVSLRRGGGVLLRNDHHH